MHRSVSPARDIAECRMRRSMRHAKHRRMPRLTSSDVSRKCSSRVERPERRFDGPRGSNGTSWRAAATNRTATSFEAAPDVAGAKREADLSGRSQRADRGKKCAAFAKRRDRAKRHHRRDVMTTASVGVAAGGRGHGERQSCKAAQLHSFEAASFAAMQLCRCTASRLMPDAPNRNGHDGARASAALRDSRTSTWRDRRGSRSPSALRSRGRENRRPGRAAEGRMPSRSRS